MRHPRPTRPRRVVARALGLGISTLAAAALLVGSPGSISGWSQSSAESTLWQLMNGARVNNGRAPVQQHATLVSLARWRSSDMLAKSYFSHTIVGCGCLVYTYYDSNGLSYDWAGENIGWNSGFTDDYSPVRVHEKFMESPGHRANVLDPSFTHGGVGAAAADNASFLGNVQNTRMYTELFMEAKGASAPPPSPPPPGSGGGSGGGGSGGGSGGGGGGGGAAPAAPAPTPTPEPVASRAEMDAPSAPSSDRVDGSYDVVSAPVTDQLLTAWLAPESAARRASAMATAGDTPQIAVTSGLEVTAARQEPGFLDGVIGAVLGFLFG